MRRTHHAAPNTSTNTRSNPLSPWEPASVASVDYQDYSSKLPSEILCLCFAFLPDLLSCITVSHVARFWRTTALGFPALWAALDHELGRFKPKAIPDLLRTALERSGGCPVVFKYHNDDQAVDPAIVDAVSAHMHHMRCLDLRISTAAMDSNGIAFFARAAPLLETLSCGAGTLSEMTPNFLGSVTSRLHTLTLPGPIFPRTCPALANVTRLTTTASLIMNDDTSYAVIFLPLFDLFPHLVELSIMDMYHVFGLDWLPSTPAPNSLRHLTLAGPCNALEYLPRFQGAYTDTVNLHILSTKQFSSGSYRDMERAVELELAEPHGQDAMHLSLRCQLSSCQQRIEISFPSATNWRTESYTRIADFLARHRLTHIERMTLPLPALGYFIRVLVNAPSLHEVCIVAQEQDGVFPWELLLHLPRLPASVTSVVLEVSYDPATQPKALDLALFLEHFRLDSPGGFGATLKAGVKYIVQGFPTELLRLGEIDIPGLTFGPAPVAETKSRGHAETYPAHSEGRSGI